MKNERLFTNHGNYLVFILFMLDYISLAVILEIKNKKSTVSVAQHNIKKINVLHSVYEQYNDPFCALNDTSYLELT